MCYLTLRGEQMQTSFLRELGFTQSEIEVYIALLELGSTTTGPLVDKSGAASSKIYEILDRLIHKGMASYVYDGKIKHFQASPPSRILDYIAEREQELDAQRSDARKLIPQLELQRSIAENKQKATIFHGMQGLRAAFDEGLAELRDGSEFIAYGMPMRTEPVIAWFMHWGRRRVERKITQRLLYNDDARASGMVDAERTLGLTQIRILPPSAHMPASISVFAKSVIIFPVEIGEEMLLIKIDDANVANSFRVQFETLWGMTSRTYTGLDGPRVVIKELLAAKEERMIGLDGNKFLEHLPKETRELDRIQSAEKHDSKLIFRENPKPKPSVGSNVQVRYLPEAYFTPLHVEIWGNSVGLIDWTEPITTVIIDKPEIAQRYRKHFEQLWKIAKP